MQKIKSFVNSDFFILAPIIFFIILRFPSLFEPHWYGDEGIYQIIGIALNKGRMLYSEIWDNKPPLLYLIYALSQGSQFIARLLSLIAGILTVVVFFYLAKRIFSLRAVSRTLTFVFVLLFGSIFLEGNIANAENFMLLPILLGMLISYDVLKQKNNSSLAFLKNPSTALFVAGIFFGIAFTLKIVGIFEYSAIAVLVFLSGLVLIKKIKLVSYLSFGFLIPMLIFILFFFSTGQLAPFFESVLFSNFSYVGHLNNFIIPQGLLILKVIILLVSLLLTKIYAKKTSFELAFILVWLCFSLFSSFFSQRSYAHYILLSMPVLLYLGGYLFAQKKLNLLAVSFYGVVLLFLFFHFKPYSLAKTFLYYGNFIGYVTKRVDALSYQKFFDADVARDYAVAEFIKMKQNPGDPLFVWGNSAQIYVTSETLPVGRYTASYHINTKEAINETIKAIEQKKPRFIVVLNDEPQKNLPLTNYAYLLTIEGAAIYENTH